MSESKPPHPDRSSAAARYGTVNDQALVAAARGSTRALGSASTLARNADILRRIGTGPAYGHSALERALKDRPRYRYHATGPLAELVRARARQSGSSASPASGAPPNTRH